MAKTITEILGAGASLSAGTLTIDFTNSAYSTYGVAAPASITATQAVDVILKHLSTLTAANDDATAAIAAPSTTSTPQYVSTRGGTATTQMRKTYQIYSYYQATDTTNDPDNLVT